MTQCARSARNGSLSGLPGPKCFRMTSGSLALGFSIANAGFRGFGGHEELVLRHVAESDHAGAPTRWPPKIPSPCTTISP